MFWSIVVIILAILFLFYVVLPILGGLIKLLFSILVIVAIVFAVWYLIKKIFRG